MIQSPKKSARKKGLQGLRELAQDYGALQDLRSYIGSFMGTNGIYTIKDLLEAFYWTQKLIENYSNVDWPGDEDNKGRALMHALYGTFVVVEKPPHCGVGLDSLVVPESIRDVDNGLRLLKLGANMGDPDAAWALVKLYSGLQESVQEDVKMRCHWLRKAAKLGDANAALQLAEHVKEIPKLYWKWLRYPSDSAIPKAKRSN